MAGWSLDVVSGGSSGGWRWLHVPGKGKLVVVFAADGWLVYTGHYWQGRVWRCREPHCTLCELSLPIISRLLVPCAAGSDGRLGVLELPGRVSDALLEVRARHGTLKGVTGSFARRRVGGQGQVDVVDEYSGVLVDVPVVDVQDLVRWLEGQDFWRGKLST